MKRHLAWLIGGALLLAPAAAGAETDVVRIPQGAGGIGFLPLLVMEKQGLVDRAAREIGLNGLRVEWLGLGGPSMVNDLLISGAADFAPAGPPAFITAWARTADTIRIKGVAAMTSIPMYLNTRSPALNSIRDLRPDDKIAVTAVKVSIPAIILQMACAREFGPAAYARLDPYTVSLTHPDGVAALLTGGTEITAHFTSPPFHQRERKAANIRTIMTTNEVMGGPSTFTMLYTTGRFHDANPKVYAAVLKALEQAIAFINADKRGAAQIFLQSSDAKGWKLEEVLDILDDKDVRFTTSPENVMTYANFMADVGTIKRRPQAWQDMFFADIHGGPGS
jgi:NitT/TauT family transport system substrate-binding protein